MKAPLPPNENERLRTLQDYGVLDTEAERDFDDLVFLASHICQAPIALVSLVDRDRQWFKSKVGIDAEETPRELAFCAHAILEDDVLLVPDATKDDRFADNPLVVDDPAIRFYAGAPLIAPNGHAMGTLCVIDGTPRDLDPTQHEALQMLARQVISQLELRKRISELSQMTADLQRMNDVANAASKAKSEFLAGMSHELRTPLNAIIGFTEGLLSRTDKHPLSDHQKNRLTRVHLAAQHLLSLINDVLDIAKVEAGAMRVQTRTFDLGDLAREVRDLTEALVATKQGAVRFTLSGADELPAMTSDREKIKQILLNLVSNAVKFTDEGDVTLSLGVGHDRSTISVDVTDTGIGIPGDELDRVFDKFHQVGGIHREGSTGLGLSLCRQLTTLLDGTLTAASDLGRGSTFTLTLPIGRTASHAAA